MKIDFTAAQAAIDRIVEERHLAGLSVCVRGTDGILFEHCWGVRDTAMTVPVDRDTMFGIASMSKSITALALCLLECEGRLSVDDPVSDWMPGFSVPGNARSAVTLRQLAMHTAGIPPMEPLEWSIAMNSRRRETDWLRAMRAQSPNRMNEIGQVIDYIANCPYKTLGAPGEYMSYSNEGYAVLSYVVDKAAGRKLEDYCREKIFLPLGMTRTIMDDDCVQARALSGGNITSLFEREDGRTLADDDWSVLPPFRGCAMVKSTAPDMAAYYRCLSAGGKLDGKQILPAAAVERLIGAEYPESAYDTYCMGLYKYARYGHVFCEHGGGLHGVSTKGGLIKGEDVGFAVLCNQGDEDTDDILWLLYSTVCGLPVDTCFRRFAPNGKEFSDPQMLTGSFTGHEGVPEHLTVTLEDGGVLRGRTSSRTFTLRWCGAARFLGYETPEAKSPCAKLEFMIRDGQSWGVRVGSRIFGRDPG